MRMLDLCAGIGGFSLAATWAGIEIAGQVEIDEFCQKVLKKNFPDVPKLRDVREFKGDEFGAIDIICAGIPCQPYSHAGKQLGANDERDLWGEIFRVVQTAKPDWIIIENVAGFISMALDSVCSDLEGIGYETRAFVVPASAVGAWHRRDRVWLIAYSDSLRKLQQKRGFSDVGRRTHNCSEKNPNPYFESSGIGGRNIEHGGKKSFEWREKSLFAQCPTQFEGYDLSAGRREWAENWVEIATKICRDNDGVPGRLDKNRRERIKALGNSIIPQIAYQIIKNIISLESLKICGEK